MSSLIKRFAQLQKKQRKALKAMTNLDDKDSFNTLATTYQFRSTQFVALYEYVAAAPAHVIEADNANEIVTTTQTATTTKKAAPSVLPAKLKSVWLNASDDLKRNVILDLYELDYPSISTKKYTEEYRQRKKFDKEIQQLADALNVCYIFIYANLR